MISPTIGRVVLFWPSRDQMMLSTGRFISRGAQPMAATVTYVWGDRMVNLSVTDHDGGQHGVTSVTLLQDGDARPAEMFCEWMPYQKGQAAKTEALEAVVAAK